jgi:predicted phage tail protein
VSFFVPEAWALAGITAQSLIFGVGSSLLLGGVLQLLSPAPMRDTPAGDPEASRYLGPPANTVAIGTRIPIGYGTFKLAGHFLSFDIRATDVALAGDQT